MKNRLTLTQEDGWWRSWVYYKMSYHVVSDDFWDYTITGGEPDENGIVYARPDQQRTRVATGEKETWKYTATNSIQTKQDVLGNEEIIYRYKTPGRLYGRTYKIERKRVGASGAEVVWRGGHDAETGDLLSSYDAEDNLTTYAYERFEGASTFQPPKKVTVSDPLGRVSSIERDLAGDIIEVINPAGVKRKLEWDSRHRLTRIKNADNEVLLRFVYGDKDQVVELYDTFANKTEMEYTIHLGEPLLTKVTTPLGRVTQWTRDSMGRMSKLKVPSTAEWQYTHTGNWSVVGTLTDPLDNRTFYEYDARLNPIRVTNALYQETETEYDDLDLPKKITDALDQVTELAWNANGDLQALTDPRSKEYTMAWDNAALRKKLEWPDAVKQEATFSADGKVTSFKPRGANATITNTWNAAGEIATQGWTNGSESGSLNLDRNAAGQIIGFSTTAQTLTVSGNFSYDAEGRLESMSQMVGNLTRTANMTYDAAGRLSGITYPAGFTIEYTRNTDGQITAIKKDGTTLASYAYDAAGRLNTRTLSNGVVTTYGYDGMDRLNQLTVTGSTTLWAERYGYNAAGERVYTLSGTSGTVGDAYWLDDIGQLRGVKYAATGADSGYATATSPAGLTTWTYDAAGNRASQSGTGGNITYSVNAINQYTDITGVSPVGYSERGDLTHYGDWEFTYDAWGNLIQAHDTNTNTLAKYWRDAFGHRAIKDVDGDKTVYFNWGTDQLEAYDINSDTASSTIYEPGIDRPLAEVSDVGVVTFYHQDWLGNVVLLTNAAGAKVQSYTYDAWGKVSGFDATGAPIATSAILSRFLFTGREFDPEIGLYHYRARTYSPELGRFIQNDPIDFSAGDYNLIRYVSNNPVNWVDPTGEFRFYGNWGGPDWVNGQKRSESDVRPIPNRGDPDYRPPIDCLDALYEQHDRDLWKAHNLSKNPCESEEDFSIRKQILKEKADTDLAEGVKNLPTEWKFYNSFIPVVLTYYVFRWGPHRHGY